MGGKPRFVLSATWRRWIQESLRLDIRAPRIVDELVSEGVPRRLAAREVQCIEQASAGMRSQLKRCEIVLNARKKLRAHRELERSKLCSRKDFAAHYLSTSTPVLFENACAAMGIVGKWTPKTLGKRLGDKQVRVSTGRELGKTHLTSPDTSFSEMSLASFLKIMSSTSGNDSYLISRNRALENNLSDLLDDIGNVPPFLRAELEGAVSLWMGPAGTHTPMHHDTSHILFCQVYGEKRLRLIAPDDTALLLAPMEHTFYTQVDLAHSGAQIFEVVVKPGQGVYLPLGWWHELEALSPSISLSFVGFRDADPDDKYRPGRWPLSGLASEGQH